MCVEYSLQGVGTDVYDSSLHQVLGLSGVHLPPAHDDGHSPAEEGNLHQCCETPFDPLKGAMDIKVSNCLNEAYRAMILECCFICISISQL